MYVKTCMCHIPLDTYFATVPCIQVKRFRDNYFLQQEEKLLTFSIQVVAVWSNMFILQENKMTIFPVLPTNHYNLHPETHSRSRGVV